MRAWMFALAILTLAGCGGASETASDEETTAGDEAPPPAAVEDPTEGGRRRAANGADCDYGGAADRTCQIGLYCCYGPPEDPGDHGTCMPECS